MPTPIGNVLIGDLIQETGGPARKVTKISDEFVQTVELADPTSEVEWTMSDFTDNFLNGDWSLSR